jgi:ribosome-associated heat shock protein Hsp15
MRLDKFLWCVRLYKTRAFASDACRLGKVQVDEVVSKSGKTVKKGMQISLRKDGITYKYTVLDIPPSRIGAPGVSGYINDITSKEELERKAFIQLASKLNRRKGLGRPTKKERRDLDDFTD